ncbi:MAG TPA: prolyl oligopeptidase family serine peptidase [Polyangiaceae bacterium]|nr:prolyl oligopeptidase family serine peptidase [Polyangiaceae bacterium]
MPTKIGARFLLALFAPSLAACAPPAPPAPAPRTPAASTAAPPAAAPAPPLPYPAARRLETTEERFGLAIRDPYRWLEDGSSPEVKAWVGAQDKLARGLLAGLPGRDAIAERLSALAYRESAFPPTRRGGRSFYSRREAKSEKRKVYWRQGEAGEERVLLDAATLSPDGNAALGVSVPSYDGKLVAYVVRPDNADAGVLHVRDVATGKDRAADVIGGAKYAVPQWTPRGEGFYYVALPTDDKIPPAELPGHSEVKFHRLGSPPSSDLVAFPKTGDPETELDATLSRDGRWLLVSVLRGAAVSELHYRDLGRPNSPWVALAKGHDGTMSATAWKGQLYLRTTDGAPYGRVVRVDPARPARDQWKELVAEDKGAVLQDARVVGGRLALLYARGAKSEVEVRGLDGARPKQGALALPEVGTVPGIWGEPDDDTAYYYFTSFTNPGAIYQFSAATGRSQPWSTTKAPVDPAAYEAEQVTYPSKDGTKVTMFVVRRKGAPRGGSTPFLLTGYGGFNVSLTPFFDEEQYAWLELGGGLAVANLRGGGEYGEAWHQAGMLAKKQNTFDDFIAAAEYLVREGYTRPERLAIAGASNGGLLVGAALTQRPDLFRVALCGVPVLDLVRYPLTGDGKTWVPEYGSPDDPALLKALLAYSPYHQVKPGTAYPALLMLTADADDRVPPLHAWKMTAALQAASSSGRPVIMRVERHAGHGGADQVKSRVERSADSLAFVLHAMGLEPGQRAAGAAPKAGGG